MLAFMESKTGLYIDGKWVTGDGTLDVIDPSTGEVIAAEFFRWFSEEAVRTPGDFRKSPSGDKRILVTHQPIGVSLLITPWNFPAGMATRKIGPAIAAGCTMILKPAGETPLTALAIVDILERAGVPKGVVNVILPSKTGPMISKILQNEVFGPVAPIVRFDTDEEAIKLANDTPFGLISYVYSQDLTRAIRTAEALEAGMVAINRGVISDPAAPFGGVKQSGLGREGGFDGIHEFLETKFIGVEI